MNWTSGIMRARVKFLTPHEGGRINNVQSGYRPDLGGFHPDYLKMSRLMSDDGHLIELGETYSVTFELLMVDDIEWPAKVGMPFTVQEGSRIVGYGEVQDAI